MAAPDRPRFVVTSRLPGDGLKLLAEAGEVVAFDREAPLPRSELLAAIAGATVVLTMLTDRVDEEFFAAAGPGLRAVANVAVGHDNIDLDAAARHGVAVTNTPGVLDDATADLALALILGASRRIAEADRLVRRGEPWEWGMSFMLGRDLRGKTLGIVGLGGIGRCVAARARGFGMEIAYSSRNPAPAEVTAALAAERVPLDALLETADVLTLHCPLTPETHHLIGAAELARMKPTALLVNTARGAVVDEAALVEALRAGTIAAAGLDVFEQEPNVHPGLLGLDNVTLVPHLGSATIETRSAMAELAARNALAAARGEPLPTPVRLPGPSDGPADAP
ncbi:MAG: D-glycerate dehydrogenase [Thermoleophilia bacterium]|nr:D-glycerate dehydrogenase [Thermoleophilia bacterium]